VPRRSHSWSRPSHRRFARTGDQGAPGGVPSIVASMPASVSATAFRSRVRRGSTRRSATRFLTRLIRWSLFTRSKNFSRARSTTQPSPSPKYCWAHATAWWAEPPGRTPHCPPPRSCPMPAVAPSAPPAGCTAPVWTDHPSSPVPGHRPAPWEGASSGRHLVMAPWPCSLPSAPLTPGVVPSTPSALGHAWHTRRAGAAAVRPSAPSPC
jgi:hypothetical protein